MDTASPISLGSLMSAVRRRWLTASLIGTAVFAAGTTGVLLLEKHYTSTATILLAPGADQLAGPGQGGAQGPGMTDPFYVHSESDIAAADGLSRQVIDRLELWDNPEFQPKFSLRKWLGLAPSRNDSGLSEQDIRVDNVLKRYQDQMTVQNDGRSNTLTVAFTASDPRLAAAIANAQAEAYLHEQSTRGQVLQAKAVEWLHKEVDDRAKDLREADALVQQYQLKNNIVSANDITLVEQRLSQLNSQLTDARRALSTQSTLLDEVRKIRKGGDAGSAAIMSTDQTLAGLLQTRSTTEANLAALEKRFAPDHPTLIKVREELAGLNKALDQHLQRMESEATSGSSWWQGQVDQLERAVATETTHKVGQDRLAVGLPSLISQAQVKRTVFENVMNRYQTLLAEQAFAAPSAVMIDPAVPSPRPSFPKVPLFLVVVAMLAAMAAVAGAALVDSRSAPSIGLHAMADAVGLRPLVSVPRFREKSRVAGRVNMADPRLFVESIRFLREAVLTGRQEGLGTVCLVTSVLPRQGKSVVAMSLARAIARAGHDTLFLEFDLRRPSGSSLARRDPPEYGVAAVLQGRISAADAAVKDANPRLDLLLAEQRASVALDNLTAVTLNRLFADLRQRYDVIIVDSPPVGIVSDALALTPLADQIILVAKDADSSLSDLQRGTRLLRERGAVVPGLVLTSVDPSHLSNIDRKTLSRYVLGVPEQSSSYDGPAANTA